ncbi:heparan-alpha-glucosaminide N-acetyltransferase-like [Watersipora subatra]|uniref:heparan-alpha-glucosaminide N-acetyltransferase-like n=1 Tax=Watersipora subatra TaxID=2589382 RepID=UPI00355ACF62
MNKAKYLLLLLTLTAVSCHHHDEMGIDIAFLEINIREYHGKGNISVLAQNTDCYQCSYVEIGTLPATNGDAINVTLYANHTTVIKLVEIEKNENKSSSVPLCTLQSILVQEHAFYKLIVRSPDDTIHNVSCQIIPYVSSEDAYLPILFLFVTLTGLALVWTVVWILFKKLYRYRRWQFANFSNNEQLVQSDLGSTNTTPSEGELQIRKPTRLASLDTFRGLSLTIMIFVNYGGGKYWFFAHSSWNGLTVADLVFPWFVFIMGTALAFVFSSHHRKGKSKWRLFVQIIVRSIKLFVLGLMVNSTSGRGHPIKLSELRIPGVLQRFSLTYLIVALTELICSSGYTRQVLNEEPRWYHRLRDVIHFWPSWLVAMTCLVLQIVITFAVPYDMDGCPTGYIGPGGISKEGEYFNCTGGIAKYIDTAVFGKRHIYQHGTCKNLYQCHSMEPEGLLGTLNSIFLCFLGVQAGRILVAYECPKARVTRWLIWSFLLGGIGALLCGASQNEGWIPVNKNLWSASYVIIMASMAFLLLSFLYVIIDVKELWSGAPLKYPGMNSIFVYVGSETLEDLVPISFYVVHTHLAQLFLNLWSTTFWVLVSAYMYYKNLFVSV